MSEINQKLVRCPADKHYYDANRYASCPHCASGEGVSFSENPNPFSLGSTVNAGTSVKTADPNLAQGSVTLPPDVVVPHNNNKKMGMTTLVDSTASSDSANESPCVGWLVEIEGKNRGKDYRLHTAYNYIGREKGDIIIRGDATISAENDSSIYYVYQTRKFYIAHESGKNGVLVNNVPALGGGIELKDRDIVTIGTTKLIFQSLCGEDFTWEDSE